MIYDPVTRQQVTIINRLPLQHHCFRFGKKVKSEQPLEFARIRYDSYEPGGFPPGEIREVDINDLRADDGSLEIRKAYDAALLIDANADQEFIATLKLWQDRVIRGGSNSLQSIINDLELMDGRKAARLLLAALLSNDRVAGQDDWEQLADILRCFYRPGDDEDDEDYE